MKTAPGFEDAWEQYRLYALYAWYAIVFTAAAAKLQAEDIVRTGLERASIALEDLDSIGALRTFRDR